MEEKLYQRSLEDLNRIEYAMVHLSPNCDDENLKGICKDVEEEFKQKVRNQIIPLSLHPELAIKQLKENIRPLSYVCTPDRLDVVDTDTPITLGLAESYVSPLLQAFDEGIGNESHFQHLFKSAANGERVLNKQHPDLLPEFEKSLKELVDRYISLEDSVVRKLNEGDFHQTLKTSDYPVWTLNKKVIDTELNQFQKECAELSNDTMRFYLFLKSSVDFDELPPNEYLLKLEELRKGKSFFN